MVTEVTGAWPKPDEETLTKVNNILKVKDGGITPAKLSFGTWEKIKEITVESDVSEVGISDLDLRTDKIYMLLINLINGDTANSRSFYLRFNDDANANYSYQYMKAAGSSVTGGSNTSATQYYLGDLSAGAYGIFIVYISELIYGDYRKVVTSQGGDLSNICTSSGIWTGPANLTKITLRQPDGNYIDTNTKIFIFRLTK